MQRFFLSGQTTCALLLGAGLLLRAQAALTKPESAPQARLETPRTRPAELFGERAPRLPRATNPQMAARLMNTQANAQTAHAAAANPSVPSLERHVQNDLRVRKGLAHNGGLHKARKCGGAAFAGRQFRCG
jgi:hypothetical protein